MSFSPKKIINVITLGCYKNLVDSEQLLKQLEINNIEIRHNDYGFEAKTVIINTCGFIADAKEESVNTILDFAKARKEGRIHKLLVMGCLSQRYKEELMKEIPEVDACFGVDSLVEIMKYLNHEIKNEKLTERIITTPSHYAYLKIAEGCNRRCSFCAIPLIRGKHRSKTIETIYDEAKLLACKGVKEIILISQDTTYYGLDLYKRRSIAKLIIKLSEIDNIEWIRLQYAFPANFPVDLLDAIAESPKICRYLDIPFQHISDRMLKLMNRQITKKETYQLIEKIRSKIPGIALRTTLLTGHPGETKKDFEQLLEFMKDIRFEKLGAFMYSNEEGTYSALNYKDNVNQKEKERRYHEIMSLQQQIASDINKERVGKELKVIIDRKENNLYYGRTEFDSPEVDGVVIISTKKSKKIEIGKFYNCIISDSTDYDLITSI